MPPLPHIHYCKFSWLLLRSPQTSGSGFLASYYWLLRYRGGPLEASGTDLLVVLLLYIGTCTVASQALGTPDSEYSKVHCKCTLYHRITAQRVSKVSDVFCVIAINWPSCFVLLSVNAVARCHNYWNWVHISWSRPPCGLPM